MNDLPRFDFHIHTKYLGCANATMEVSAIVAECERLGVKSLGITDHLNTLERLEPHRSILSDIRALKPKAAVYFGVELNFLGPDGEFAFNDGVKAEYEFQFAIGGIHNTYLETYDLKAMIDIQHRHHLKTCADPLVDVLVHPYWFGRKAFEQNGWPWFDSMRPVPEHYARELGQAARETGTAIEINGCANLENPAYSDQYVNEYIDFLAAVAAEGPCFAMGSDAHDIGRLGAIRSAWRVAEQLGLTADRIWRPHGQPMAVESMPAG